MRSSMPLIALFLLLSIVPTSSAQQGAAPTIDGGGTTNYVPIWTSSTTLGNSNIYQAGSSIGIGTTTPGSALEVHGDITATTYKIAGSTMLNGDARNANVFLGPGAGARDIAADNKGVDNTFLGRNAGVANTTGQRNSFTGAFSGTSTVTGSFDTFTGEDTGFFNTTGSYNTFTGRAAGYYSTTGSNDIFEGYDAGILNKTGSDDIYVGNEGNASGNESNTIRLGDPVHQTATYIAGIYGSTASSGVPVYIDSNGQLGTSPSSIRFKEQVRNMGDYSSKLMQLRPVTFVYKPEYDRGLRTLQYGLIAEEVAKIYPELVAYDNDGRPYTVRYQYLASMLLNEVQKEHHHAEAQAVVITEQADKIEALEQRLSRLERLLEISASTSGFNHSRATLQLPGKSQ